jgi:molybdopterin-guanine dinucleotide biosynthesis protein A
MGRNKAFLERNGRPLVSIVVERLAEACDEVMVVAGEVQPYQGLGVPVVTARGPGVGGWGGLHAGLGAASCDLALAVGCDMPFLNPQLLRAFGAWAQGFDVALLRRGEYVEPLHAAYRRSCLSAIEATIAAGERRIVSFFDQVEVRYVSPDEVAALDPEFHSFRNVNTPEEWKAVLEKREAG